MTWAPSGALFHNGSVYFAGLRGQALYEYNIGQGVLEEHFKNSFGRLRTVRIHNDKLYLLTSNKDGRGTINDGDDKIIRINR